MEEVPNVKCAYVELIDIHKLIPHPKNPNKHPDEQIERLAKIIDYQGMRSPIVVSRLSGFITKGHGRLLSLAKLGWTKVPVDYQDYENEAQEYSDIVSDNAIAEWAAQDLSQINLEMLDLGPDIDVDLLGIKDFVIEPIEKYDEATEDDVPEVNHDPITKRGDVWLLGNHRVMCGDSTNIEDIDILMNGDRANILFTSPPYNAGDEVEIGTKGHKYENHDDSMSGDSYLQLLIDFTSVAIAKTDISIVNIQHLAGNKIQFIEYLNHFKNHIVDIGIWNKTHGTPCLPKRVMNSAFEYVVIFSAEENPPKTIKSAPMFHGTINNVYSGQKQTKNEFSGIHRATFPVHLPEYYIKTMSTGSVVDLFNGVGTTLIACQKLGRNYFGMDMDPLYIDTTIKRWEDFTGKKAELLNGNI